MHKISKWKIFISVLFTSLALLSALPNFTTTHFSWMPKNTLNLGLDLRGGSHLLLEVDFDNYQHDLLESITDGIRKVFRDEKIGYKGLKIYDTKIQFNLRESDQYDLAKRAIKKFDSKLSVDHKDGIIEVFYDKNEMGLLKNNVIDQSIEIIRMRVDATGTTEPTLQRQGEKYILLQVPGESNPSNLKNILGKTAKLTFHLVDDTVVNLNQIPPGSMLVQTEENGKEGYIPIKKKIIVSGDQLINAQVSFNQYSQPVVAFAFNSFGAKLFADATKNNSGKRLAIILDKKLLSAPMINEPILGGSGIITGNFSVESANELALLLRAGALPAPLKIVEERSVGATLGVDSIEAGKKAGIIGFASVVIFMIWTYGLLGIFASFALSLAMLYIIALLSLLQATLTLPGIAGIILTIGMAVDANVLIYERIKEELSKGSSNLYSIKIGFESAFATIADSNITTLIVAMLLYIFGIGAIRGFAVTLTIGIVASMFSAIVITKLLIDIWTIYFKPKKLGLI